MGPVVPFIPAIGGAIAGLLIGVGVGWFLGRRRRGPGASRPEKEEEKEEE